MSIVAYISAFENALRARVTQAVGDEHRQYERPGNAPQVIFRDPATFQPADADPLDRVVYVTDYDMHIRAAHARHGAEVRSLETVGQDPAPVETPGAPESPAPESRANRRAPESAAPAAPEKK